MTVRQPTLPRIVSSPTRARPAARWRLFIAGLAGLDVGALTVAFALAFLLRFKAGVPLLETPPHSLGFYSAVAFWAVPAWLVIFYVYRLYDRRRLFAGFQEYTRVAHACTIGTIAILVMSFLDLTLVISRGWLILAWLLSILLVCAGRFAARRLLRQFHRRGWLLTPTLIIGTNEEGRALAEQFGADPGSGIRVVGLVDGGPSANATVAGEVPVVGSLGDLREVVDHTGAQQLVVATSALSRPQLLDLYRTFGQDEAVDLRLSSGLFEILTTPISVQEVSSVALMAPERVRITGVDALLKTTFDYLIAATTLVLASPLLLLIGLLVKADSPGPALYRRRVLGRSGKPFDAFKFRTMVVNADEVLARDAALRAAFEQGFKLKADPRVTRVGRFLRRTSLDELPQLINVLRGEMSLIGPRMIVPDEADRYGKWQLNLLTVKPGITGPWQVQGRSDIPYEERVRLSMHYIRNYSLWLDLEILVRTFLVVLRGKGAY